MEVLIIYGVIVAVCGFWLYLEWMMGFDEIELIWFPHRIIADQIEELNTAGRILMYVCSNIILAPVTLVAMILGGLTYVIFIIMALCFWIFRKH